ncbi:hypothetical protein EDD22DRAFT_850632 [Suillus occidentalis]|nr:hypothetical protein EDD22DRAFT_850632 [Suillus occidentalis]
MTLEKLKVHLRSIESHWVGLSKIGQADPHPPQPLIHSHQSSKRKCAVNASTKPKPDLPQKKKQLHIPSEPGNDDSNTTSGSTRNYGPLFLSPPPCPPITPLLALSPMAQARLVEFDSAVGISNSTLYVDDPCANENDSEDYSAEGMQGWQGIDGAEPEIDAVTNEVNDWDNGPCEIPEPQHTLACDLRWPLPLETKVEATRAVVQPTGETAHCGCEPKLAKLTFEQDHLSHVVSEVRESLDANRVQWDNQRQQWDIQCKQWNNSHPVIEPNLIQLLIPQPENLESGEIAIDIEEGEIC